MSDEQKTRPFLKWAGGKRRLLEQYAPYFPVLKKKATYFEPFLGGGAIFFRLLPAKAQLSDINEELINTYIALRDETEQLRALIRAHARNHNEEYYYYMRDYSPKSDLRRAARFIYLNRTCYNGLYRVNSKGKFNVPMGRYKAPFKNIDEWLVDAAIALQHAKIEVSSFEAVTKAAKSGDLVYFDPPYQPISDTAYFTSYSKDSFREEDQRRLAEVFAELTKKKVFVMLSNSDHPLIRELYAKSAKRIVDVKAGRAINSKASKRGAITELLVLNY